MSTQVRSKNHPGIEKALAALYTALQGFEEAGEDAHGSYYLLEILISIVEGRMEYLPAR